MAGGAARKAFAEARRALKPPKPPKPPVEFGPRPLMCCKMHFYYTEKPIFHRSRGMMNFLKHRLPPFQEQNPTIEMSHSSWDGPHPGITATYGNIDLNQILKIAERLRNSSGEKVRD